MIYKLNGEVFNINQQHRIGDVNYPHTWFQHEENRAAMGITEEPDPVIVRPLAEVQAEAINRINADAQMRILTKYPLWVQANCANEIYSLIVTVQMKADIAAVITAANIATDAVTAAIDESGVTAITVVWPVI